MQPFHFESFIVNYVVLISVVILSSLLWQRVPHRALLWSASLCILLGVVEVSLATGAFHKTDVTKDEMIPALRRLKELSVPKATPPGLVFSPHFELMQILPTWAPQGTLLAVGAIDFGSASHQERKEFLYAHLYYSGTTVDRLRDLFKGIPDELALSYYVKYAIFGHERVRPLYALNFQALTQDEIETEVSAYARFVDSFSREEVLKHPLSYAVTLTDDKFDFSHIDLWYERDAGQHVGAYSLYRLKLRK